MKEKKKCLVILLFFVILIFQLNINSQCTQKTNMKGKGRVDDVRLAYMGLELKAGTHIVRTYVL